MRRQRKRRWKWVLLGVAVVCLGLMATGWMMFQHVPDWYRPPVLTPEERERYRYDFQGTENVLTESLQHARGPFEHRFSQDRVNGWISVREETWEAYFPPLRDLLPPFVQDPFVAFEPGGVRVASTVSLEGIQSVVSARLEVAKHPEGIFVRLAEIQTGALSLPTRWIRERLAELDDAAWPAGQRVPLQVGGPPLPELTGILDGIVLPDSWVWVNGEVPFRIKDIQCRQGELSVMFERLPRQSAHR